MSSSKKKLLRKEEAAAQGIDSEMTKKGLSKRLKIGLSAIAAVLVLALVCLFVISTGALNTSITALTIGNEKISVAEYNFSYFSEVNSYVTNLSNYGITAESMGLDLSKPLDSQSYIGGEEGETWDDYFREQTNTNLHEMMALYIEAKAEGITLPDETNETIDKSLEDLKTYCETNGTTVDQYFKDNYGQGVNEKVARTVIERSYLADYYSSQKGDSFQFDDAEVQTYYDQNKAEFDYVDYRSFSFYAETAGTEEDDSEDAATDAELEASMIEIKQKADKMLSSITDEASFAALALENASEDQKATYQDPASTLTTKGTSSYLSDETKAWLYDAQRKAGDKTVVKEDNGYTVLYMIKRYRPSEPTISIRHILVEPEAASDALEATDEQKAAAKAAAEEIYNTWLGGDKSEDSFAALAIEKSTDPGSVSNGGLYENVYPGQMVGTFDAWCFDSARKAGDTGIVETSYGYHIMYFVGKGEDYWKIQVKDTLTSNAYNDYMVALEEKYKMKKNVIGMSISGKI